jgi:hypothetical protein
MGFDLDKCLEKAMKGEKLDELNLKLICQKIKEIFITENNIQKIPAPVTCIGDIHGQFLDL